MLEIRNVSKNFGQVQALKNVSFQVERGDLFGIIGQNGAGKSTLFRSIMDFYEYEGEILYDGMPMSKVPLEKIGFLPEERALSPKKTIAEQIRYFAELNQMGNISEELIEEWFKRFEIKGKLQDKIKDLSKGNQQKVQLLCTLIYEPDFVILDEPFSGLDPYNISLLQRIIKEINKKGTTIIFSSHNMQNIEDLCNKLVMIKNGEVVLNGTPSEIRNSFARDLLIVETDQDLGFLEGPYPDLERVGNRWTFHLTDEKQGEEIYREIHEKVGYVPYFSQTPPTLNEIFARKVKEDE